MKIKQKIHKKTKKILFIVSVSLIVLFLAVFFVSDKTLASLVEGWGVGIWNDLVIISGVPTDTGIPTIGRLSSKDSLCGSALSKKYSINFGGADEDEERPILGSAWFGIGSEEDQWDQTANCPGGDADLPSLGWLNFSAGAPSFCTGDDCHAAMWHKNEGGTGKEGYLDGWAQVTSMGDNGWVRLRGDNDGEKYKVTLNSAGKLSGFGWNSGTGDAIPGNSGLGWINMEGLKPGDCKLGFKTIQLCPGEKITDSSCDPSKYCTGNSPLSCSFTSDTSWTCSNNCGDVDGRIFFINPKIGVCGELNGRYICSSDTPPTANKLCSEASAYNNDLSTSGITTTWTCGNRCGKTVNCSASVKCGWTEINP